MRTLMRIFVGGLLILLPQVAAACEVQKAPAGAVVQGAPATASDTSAQSAAPVPDLTLKEGILAQPKKGEGTVVEIPGLGRLGVIPKLDFGLELLYGASGDAPRIESEDKSIDDPDQDLRIRGSIKHRF